VNGVASLVAPVLTPEQRIDAQIAQRERQIAVEEAERLSRQQSRDR